MSTNAARCRPRHMFDSPERFAAVKSHGSAFGGALAVARWWCCCCCFCRSMSFPVTWRPFEYLRCPAVFGAHRTALIDDRRFHGISHSAADSVAWNDPGIWSWKMVDALRACPGACFVLRRTYFFLMEFVSICSWAKSLSAENFKWTGCLIFQRRKIWAWSTLSGNVIETIPISMIWHHYQDGVVQ